MKTIIDTFNGGMNMVKTPTKLAPNESMLLVNARTRYDRIENVLGVLDITTNLPLYTILQGHYTIDKYHIVFADGLAYYRDVTVSSIWTQVVGFQMSPSATQIYAQPVSAATTLFKRVPRAAATGINTFIDFTTGIGGSDGGLVCQDGVSQPWIILTDATARVLQNYDEWDDTTDAREYVPIGTVMAFADGILYIVKGNKIMRSVTGRPLDFMVNINASGNKLATELLGGALTVAYSVDANNINAICATSLQGALFVSTQYNCYLVFPRVAGSLFGENLVFGEPTFANIPIANTGTLDQFSAIEVNGNLVFPTKTGLRAFNPTKQVKWEGRNYPFAKTLAKLFKDIRQSHTASINYDDYVIFAMQTIYGFGLVVYDTLNEVFTSLDLFDELAAFIPTQFAIAKVDGDTDLLFLMGNNKLYQLYCDETATAQYYAGEFCSNNPDFEQKLQALSLIFNDVTESGTVTIKVFIDRKLIDTITEAVLANSTTQTIPLTVPFGNATEETTDNVAFTLDHIKANGWKVGYLISWNFDGNLTHVSHESTDRQAAQSDRKAASIRG